MAEPDLRTPLGPAGSLAAGKRAGRVMDHARAEALGAQTFGSLLSDGT